MADNEPKKDKKGEGKYKNLTHTLTEEEARKGGINSGIARRERKTFKEDLITMLSDSDIQERISTAIIKRALDGDIRAFEVIRDTIGEKPIEKTENGVILSYEAVLKEVEDKHEY